MQVVPLRSSKDPLFKAFKQLRTLEGRARARCFLIEDADALRTALAHGHRVSDVVASEAWLATAPVWFVEACPRVHAVTAGLLHKLFPTGKTPEVVAACDNVTRSLEALDVQPRLLVLEDIQDAGNLGSMLRTAAGLGVRDVVVLQGQVSDLYNRVAVRASMGALFRLRVFEGSLPGLTARLSELDTALVVTTPHTDEPLESALGSRPLALAVGNETRGASDALLAAADHRVRIEMSDDVESLNVGAACAIALYALRARRG